jgi:hypothetical protein
MIGLTLARTKHLDLDSFADSDVPKMGNRMLNLISEAFAEYVRRNKLSGQVLDVISGETRDSVGFYKIRNARTSKWVVRPGLGIPGHLNYLAGFARGMMVSVRGHAYTVRPRPFMKPGWKEFRASGEVKKITGAVRAAYLSHAAKRNATVEVVEAGV